MERKTFSVIFYLRRTRMNRNGEAPIVIRITIDGTRADAVIKKTINPDQWDSVKGKASEKNNRKGYELNLYMDAIRCKITHIQRELELDRVKNITPQMILNRWLGRDEEKRHTILEVFREHNEKCHKLAGIDMAPATIERYETCLKLTAEFIRFTYKRDDFYLDEMNRQFIEDYEFYLKTERKCNHNTTTKYLKNFKKITRIAMRKEWLKKDPFSEIRFHLAPVERAFLEKHEIEKIYKKEITIKRLEQVRDVFIFCCFTGLAFSDVKQLNESHIFTDVSGNKWIRKSRQKTHVMSSIPLLDIPLRIIQKYKDTPECSAKNVLLPVLCNQKMNGYIKEIADICGIEKQLSTHTARHTFATTTTLAQGVPIETVSKMLGHTNIKTTQIYARITNSKISHDMKDLADKIKGIENVYAI